MTVASVRAQAVAEILWELKQADKIATLSLIANRAGFSPGSNGRTANNCLKTVRRDWSHLQWWRAVPDNGQVEEEQQAFLVEAGIETEATEDGTIVVKSLDEHLMNWDEPDDSEDGDVASAVE
ncbi:MAG: hypothetical protein JW888_17930 [Pirellulales bacterium]|nr:hypothetical protein [Pirellulales bacterium]